jgi:hypothetical protein
MTMVSSGHPISLGGNATFGGNNESVDIELGNSSNTRISLGCSSVRCLAGVSSGAISLSNLYGKSRVIPSNSGILTVNGSYTLPQTAGSSINILVIGGGGGGGGGTGRDQSHNGWCTGAGGGGSGGNGYDRNYTVTTGSTVTFSIGNGGTAGVTRDGTYTCGSNGENGGLTPAYINSTLVVSAGAGVGGQVAPNATGGAGGINSFSSLLTPSAGGCAGSGNWTGGIGAQGYFIDTTVGISLSSILIYGSYGQTFGEYSGIAGISGTGYGAGGSGGGSVQSDQGLSANAQSSAGQTGAVFIWWGY